MANSFYLAEMRIAAVLNLQGHRLPARR